LIELLKELKTELNSDYLHFLLIDVNIYKRYHFAALHEKKYPKDLMDLFQQNVSLLSIWHCVKHLGYLIWKNFCKLFFGELFWEFYPTVTLISKPSFSFIGSFINLFHLAYLDNLSEISKLKELKNYQFNNLIYIYEIYGEYIIPIFKDILILLNSNKNFDRINLLITHIYYLICCFNSREYRTEMFYFLLQLKIMKEQNNPIIYLLENYPGLLQEEPGEIYFSQLSHCIQKDTDKSDVKILNDKFLYLGYMNNI